MTKNELLILLALSAGTTAAGANESQPASAPELAIDQIKLKLDDKQRADLFEAIKALNIEVEDWSSIDGSQSPSRTFKLD